MSVEWPQIVPSEEAHQGQDPQGAQDPAPRLHANRSEGAKQVRKSGPAKPGGVLPDEPPVLVLNYPVPPVIKRGHAAAGFGMLRVGEPIKRSAAGSWVQASCSEAEAPNRFAVDASLEAQPIEVICGGIVNVKVAAITPAYAKELADRLGGTYIPGFEYLKFGRV